MTTQPTFARIVSVAVLAMLLSRTVAAGADGAKADLWANALKPAGKTAPPLRIVADGAPRYAILLPSTPTPPEQKAAADLREWLGKLAGTTTLPIAREDNKPDGITRFISIGNTQLLKQSGSDGKYLADEGYEIAVADEHLFLRGGATRGIVNAVYALLEEDLGCRWYTREGDTRLPPPATSLTLTVVPRSYVPRLKLRDPHYDAAFEPVWSLRNRTNAPNAAVPEEAGGHMDYGGYFVHTHADLLPPATYFKDHPEYFAQNAAGQRYTAQLCPTNPDVARIVTENVLNVLEKSPQTEIISVSKNDNFGDQICLCPVCAKLRGDEGGTDAANQLFLVNQVADAVAQKYPRVVVDTLAYLETSGVPKTIRPRPNVAIRFCNDARGAWSYPFTSPRTLDTAVLAKSWSAVHTRIHVWDYTANFSHYLAPMPNMGVLAESIRFWVENNAEGILLQGGYQGIAERDSMRVWVLSKLLWDPSRDVNALVADFIQGHYGEAAGPMAAYDALLNGLLVEHGPTFDAPPGGIRYPMDAPFLTKEFLDRATELFAEASKLAAGNEKLLRAVERAELPVLYVKLSRGPQFVGDTYGLCVDRFEKVARREGVRYLAEGPADFDTKLAGFRQQVSKDTP